MSASFGLCPQRPLPRLVAFAKGRHGLRIETGVARIPQRRQQALESVRFDLEEGGQKQKAKGGGGDEEAGEKGEGGQKLAKKGDDLKGEMDDLLDEIDNVLEENAEEFVKNYVQRGGQ
jgi:ubiquitin-like protein Pup